MKKNQPSEIKYSKIVLMIFCFFLGEVSLKQLLSSDVDKLILFYRPKF